jgi:hypothetical protein
MKRKMLLLTLALPVIFSQDVQAQASRLVAQSHYRNDGSSFVPVDSTNYSYSGSRGGDLTHILKYDNATILTFSGDTAYNDSLYFIETFDASNNLTSKIAKYWSGTSWVLYTNNLYTYNTGNMLTSMILQSWGGTSWVPVTQNVYTYSGTKLVKDKLQLWNSATSAFDQDLSQKNYYYDPASGLLTNETDINFVSGIPVNSAAIDYTYTLSNQLLTSTNSSWNGASWTPLTMNTNTYDTSGNIINKLYQTYDNSTMTWTNNTLHVYSNFTPHHDPQIDILQTWDTTAGGKWNNIMQFTNTYNTGNQLTSTTGESWNIAQLFEFAANDPMYNYYYEKYSAVAVKIVSNNNSAANIYPVPAQNMLHIDLNWKQAQAASIAIYDMTGRIVDQVEVAYCTQYSGALSVNHLASGTYMVKINGVQEQIVKQFVVAH